jgi:hypothetical protein
MQGVGLVCWLIQFGFLFQGLKTAPPLPSSSVMLSAISKTRHFLCMYKRLTFLLYEDERKWMHPLSGQRARITSVVVGRLPCGSEGWV